VTSPLYLYGKVGDKVTVNVLTPVSDTNPTHDGKLTATLQRGGNMQVNGKSYDSIDFNYKSAIKRLPQLKYGAIVAKSEVRPTLREYAQKLGLNENETSDLLQYGQSVVTSDYVFLSFFDHETSHAILPITFDPKPDVYRNIVFYFKNLDQKPNYSIQPPKFVKIERKGFTAIEISGIVE